LAPPVRPAGLIDADCQGSLISNKNTLFLSNNVNLDRQNLSVSTSDDAGINWTPWLIVKSTYSGYSDLVSWYAGEHYPERFGILFENWDTRDNRYERISFSKWDASFGSSAIQ